MSIQYYKSKKLVLTYLNDLHRELEEGPYFDENSDTLNEGTFNIRRQGTFNIRQQGTRIMHLNGKPTYL